jgi:hypothetical protein
VSQLRPILKDKATDVEKWLLRSARLDVPSTSGKRRALAALGFAAAATTTAGTSGVAAAATAGAGWLIKCVAVGTVGGMIVAGTVEGVSAIVAEASRSPRSQAPTVTVPAQAVSQTSEPPAPVASPVTPLRLDQVVREETNAPQQVPAGTVTARITRREQAPAARVEPSFAPSVEHELPPRGPTLAEEVGALDRARGALASGDVEAAAQVLDAYELRIATPRLRLEETVLRIEVLLAQGQFDRARQLGEKLLAVDTGGAYAQHVRSLLDARR